MSFTRVLTGIWRNSAETSDRATDPRLKTRYYKAGRRDLIEKIGKVVNAGMPGWKITHTDEERGEILAEKKGIRHLQLVITVYQVEPRKCAVDLVAAYREGYGDLGLSYFATMKFFEALNKEIAPIQN